jgi:hypothetical protein
VTKDDPWVTQEDLWVAKEYPWVTQDDTLVTQDDPWVTRDDPWVDQGNPCHRPLISIRRQQCVSGGPGLLVEHDTGEGGHEDHSCT